MTRRKVATGRVGRSRQIFRVRLLGMTGRVAILLFLLVLLPMSLTAWMIEQGRLRPGENLYFAVPFFLLFVLVPLARCIAGFLVNRDLMVINRFCNEIKNGNYRVDFDLGREQQDEDQFLLLLRNLSWMSHTLAARQASTRSTFDQVRLKYQRVEEQARTDPLTGLYNRRYFDRMLHRLAAVAGSNEEPLSLIFIDCDKFKEVNDTLGHQAGDQVLIDLAKSIRTGIRSGKDIPFRFGGDEFAVLLPQTSGEQAMEVAERIRSSQQQASACAVTLSIGIGTATFVQSAWEPQAEDMLRAADRRTYAVKMQGGNNIDLEHLGDEPNPNQVAQEQHDVVMRTKKY